MDIEKHKVIAQKKEAELTAMEFRLLVTLMERRGRVQSRDRLLEDVWGITSDIDTRTVDTHIKRLRSKLGRAGNLSGHCVMSDINLKTTMNKRLSFNISLVAGAFVLVAGVIFLKITPPVPAALALAFCVIFTIGVAGYLAQEFIARPLAEITKSVEIIPRERSRRGLKPAR